MARQNLSCNANVDMSSIYASGAFRNVFVGRYTSGPRNGEKCAVKLFKDRSVYEEKYFATDIAVTDKAIEIVKKWNAEKIIDKVILVFLMLLFQPSF